MTTNLWRGALAALATSAAIAFVVASPAIADEEAAPKPADSPGAAGPLSRAALGALAKEGLANALQMFEESKTRGDVSRAIEAVHRWSLRVVQSETDPAEPASGRKAARAHSDRMKTMAQLAREHAVSDPELTLNARYYRTEAMRMALEADDPADSGTVTVPAAAVPTPARDARTLAVLKALDQAPPMNFANETPFEDFLKYVKTATKSADFPSGLPVYVDPVGFQEAEKTLTSPVTISLEGIPLRRTLQLALKQMGLVYFVDDGLIVITAESSDASDRLPPAIKSPSPREELHRKAERGELSVSERKAYLELLKDLAEIKKLLNPETQTGGDPALVPVLVPHSSTSAQ